MPQARIYKVWNIPEYGAPDTTYLDLVTDVLAQGKNSRLYKRLVYEDQIATDVGGLHRFARNRRPGADRGHGAARRRPRQGRGGDQRRAGEVPQGRPDRSEEMERVKTQYRARFLRGIERIGGFGGKSDILIQGQVFTGQPDFYKVPPRSRRQRHRRRHPAGVTGMALRRRLTSSRCIPSPHYKNQRRRASTARSCPRCTRSRTSIFPTRAKRRYPTASRSCWPSGTRFPIVDFELLVDAGYAADQFAAPGTASLTMDMIDEGTKTRSSLEISEALDRLGRESRRRLEPRYLVACRSRRSRRISTRRSIFSPTSS